MPRRRVGPTPSNVRISIHYLPVLIVIVVVFCTLSPQRQREACAYTLLSPTTVDGSSRVALRFQSVTNVSYQRVHRGYHRDHTLFESSTNDAVFGGARSNSTIFHDGRSNYGHEEDVAVFGYRLPSAMVVSPRSRSINNRLSPSALPSLSGRAAPLTKKTNPNHWKERLIDVSNVASLLCVLDCTLLPLVSIAIPALSWSAEIVSHGGMGGGGSTAIHAATAAVTANTVSNNNVLATALTILIAKLPAVSHNIALWFVLPVGLVTSIVNYIFGHKQLKFTIVSVLGLALIYLANSGTTGTGIPFIDAWLHSLGIVVATAHGGSGEHFHDACGAVVGVATAMLAHTCPEGLVHRLTNTVGCAFVLGSNHYGRQYSKGCMANALTEAWGEGGEDSGIVVCLDPRCYDPNCEVPSNGRGTSDGSGWGGETFFRWERSQSESN